MENCFTDNNKKKEIPGRDYWSKILIFDVKWDNFQFLCNFIAITSTKLGKILNQD